MAWWPSESAQLRQPVHFAHFSADSVNFLSFFLTREQEDKDVVSKAALNQETFRAR